ncbi:hypothetical protein F2Q69_00011047 [Brassica cretica]|uniref:Uncharacterized protein n=1 Tax=Brassica cretica TaxID=69181 RepID=A0A8S9R3J2_BRACR|nr:hypothetical protein F2Q69_00011047 [Brassica cretica]
MIKNRLRFLWALVRKKPIDFGRLVYDQVLEMACSSDADEKIILPNFIYQTLILQRKITALPGDEPLIGHPLRISGDEVDSHIPRVIAHHIHFPIHFNNIMARPQLPNLPDEIMSNIIVLVGEESALYLGAFMRAGVEEGINVLE